MCLSAIKDTIIKLLCINLRIPNQLRLEGRDWSLREYSVDLIRIFL